MNTFKGTGVAMVTPFTSNGNIDFTAVQRLTHHLVDGGVEYLVILGTTGESPTVSPEEKSELLAAVAEANAGRLPLVLGIGGNNTAACCVELEKLDPALLSGILSASPYYNKPTQAGIVAHFTALSSSTSLPLILYNVPGRTASNLTADTTLTIAERCANVVAIKEASGNMEQIMTLIARKPEGFQIISGDDGITLPLIASGAAGVISVVANAFPRTFSEMVRACLAGNFIKARPAHLSLLEITRLFFADGNPAGVKEALAALSICGTRLRLPLVAASEAIAAGIKLEMKKNQFS